MKILIVNESTIPVLGYGGTERVVWYLGKELATAGHTVAYATNKNSRCDFGEIIAWKNGFDFKSIIPDDVDLIHFNTVPEDLDLSTLEYPYIITMHGNPGESEVLDRNTVFVSANHAERYGATAFVHNGLDWSDYPAPELDSKREYFHFLGDASWRVKNVRGAIDIVAATKNQQLYVLGGNRVNFRMGFRLTLPSRIKFMGMVGGTEKSKLINGSKGLIFPVLWDEPFGLAIIESLYFGCPVFGTPYGSLPELIPHQVGFLSDKIEEHVAAIRQTEQFSKLLCHQYAVEHFNSKKMADSYLQKYAQVISGQFLNSSTPKLVLKSTEKFLPWS
ncbi:MAG TPA: glycosyltransferase [Saprospiraceae bacterium]|nr:glycosyltransferase [Saprospiraceae bacterium]